MEPGKGGHLTLQLGANVTSLPMHGVRYHVKLSRDTNGTILVEVPDVPGALTFGGNREEALLRAPDAIETVLMGFNGRPSRHSDAPRRLQKALCNPTGIDGAKLALYTAMRTARVSKAELARRLNWHLPQLDRVLDLRHASRFDELEAGFRTLGKQLSVRVSEAA